MPSPDPTTEEAPRASLRTAKIEGRRAIASARQTYADAMKAMNLEVTLMSWLRTTIAAIAFGFFLARTEIAAGPLLRAGGHGRAGAVLGIAVILVSAAASGAALHRFFTAHRALRDGVPLRTTALGPVAVAIGAALAGLLVLALLLAIRAA